MALTQAATNHALPTSARLSRRAKLRRAPEALALIADDDEPPFDPPDELSAPAEAPEDTRAPDDDSAIRIAETAPTFTERREVYMLPPESALPRPPKPAAHLSETPAPPIKILATWDRADIAEQLDYFKNHTHLARARTRIERGGLEAAIQHCSTQRSPDLLIIDTNYSAAAMLDGVDRLKRVMHANTHIIIIGAINDVTLLRGLAARGVAEYIVPPARRDDLVRTVCRLFAESDPARVIAIMGARGGVGASTIAQNLAWSIAARHDAPVSLIDLNLAYGDDAFAYGEHCSAETYEAGFDRISIKRLHRLSVLAASNGLRKPPTLTPDTLCELIAAARRDSAIVILDLPHDWNAWIKAALCLADERLLVLTPDLAALRNAEAILRQLKAAKPKAHTHVALSQTGAPGRPDIPLRDVVEALGAQPSATFAFDPTLVGLASMEGRMIAEAAPRSPLALQLDQIADDLTGFDAAPVVKEKSEPANAVSHPYTFRAPSEPRAPRVHPAYYTAAAESAKLLAAARPKKRTKGRPAVRSSLRVAALVLLLVVSTTMLIEAQRESSAASSPPPAPITQAPQQITQAPPPSRIADDFYAAAQNDPANALTPLQRAASLGHCRAMHDLAMHFASGDIVAQDNSAAYRWFRQAAELGVTESQYNLGLLYQQGIGAPASLSEALFWFNVAALKNDTAARDRADTLARALATQQVSNAEARAQAFRARTSPLCPGG